MRLGKLLAVRGDHFLAGLDDAAQIAIVIQRASEIQMRVGEYRLLGDRPTQFTNRFFELPGLIERQAQPVMRPGHLIVEGERSAKLDYRLIKLASLKQRGAQAVMRRRVGFILFEGRAVGCDRFVELAYPRVSEAEVVMCIGIGTAPIRDCAVVSLDRFLDFALRVVGGA